LATACKVFCPDGHLTKCCVGFLLVICKKWSSFGNRVLDKKGVGSRCKEIVRGWRSVQGQHWLTVWTRLVGDIPATCRRFLYHCCHATFIAHNEGQYVRSPQQSQSHRHTSILLRMVWYMDSMLPYLAWKMVDINLARCCQRQLPGLLREEMKALDLQTRRRECWARLPEARLRLLLGRGQRRKHKSSWCSH